MKTFQVFVSAVSIIACCCFATQLAAQDREYYELRIYQISDIEKQELLLQHLEQAYLPALRRMQIDRVGVFTDMKNENDHSVFMLIPFKSLDAFGQLNANLAEDAAFQATTKSYFDRPLKDPVFQRVESRLLKAFESMPVLEQPEFSRQKSDRMFELRLYESHTEDHARRKVRMFNEGETQLMRDVKMGPVFFGETLVGPTVPNLVYMLSAESEEAHQEHWQTFLKDPKWAEMKDLPEFKDTVSKIRNWFLKPVGFSEL